MTTGLDMGFEWSPGSIARWLWELGEMSKPPPGIAEPYRMLIDGDWGEAANAWAARGVPFERSLALMHGDQADRLEALEPLEELGATAVAARHRRELRGAGVSVPRGRSRETRRHPAGLTARQAEDPAPDRRRALEYADGRPTVPLSSHGREPCRCGARQTGCLHARGGGFSRSRRRESSGTPPKPRGPPVVELEVISTYAHAHSSVALPDDHGRRSS